LKEQQLRRRTPPDSFDSLLVRAAIHPDPWQSEVFTEDVARKLVLCSRQAGKSFAAGANAVKIALEEPDSLTLILSPTLRQSGEFFRDKVVRLYRQLDRKVRIVKETMHDLELANGSRIISLPDNEEGIRTYAGVRLLILDEASRISDGLYKAVRPMLAVSGGELLALTTPFGKRGWFWEAWSSPDQHWRRWEVKADQCSRITPEFLAEERLAMGERWYLQEYFCSFEDAEGAVFSGSDIAAMFVDEVEPLFRGPGECRSSADWTWGRRAT
jgi:hypothetical protein